MGAASGIKNLIYGLVLYSLKQEFDVVVLKGAFFQPKLGWNSTYTAWIFDSASDLVSFPAPFVVVRTSVLIKLVSASPAMHSTEEQIELDLAPPTHTWKLWFGVVGHKC